MIDDSGSVRKLHCASCYFGRFVGSWFAGDDGVAEFFGIIERLDDAFEEVVVAEGLFGGEELMDFDAAFGALFAVALVAVFFEEGGRFARKIIALRQRGKDEGDEDERENAHEDRTCCKSSLFQGEMSLGLSL